LAAWLLGGGGGGGGFVCAEAAGPAGEGQLLPIWPTRLVPRVSYCWALLASSPTRRLANSQTQSANTGASLLGHPSKGKARISS